MDRQAFRPKSSLLENKNYQTLKSPNQEKARKEIKTHSAKKVDSRDEEKKL